MPYKSNNQRIVVNTAIFTQLPTLFFESLLATKLINLGSDVYVLINNGILRHDEMISYGHLFKNKPFSIREISAMAVLNKLNIYKKYSDFVTKKELEEVSYIAYDMIKKTIYL